MKPRTVASNRVANRTVQPDPSFMQKYSDEVRERIAKNAYELFEQRGRQAGRELEDWLEAEEIVMKEMNDTHE